MASKWLKFKGMYNGQNMEHATHAFKALKRCPRQANKHDKGTEIICRVAPNHRNDASNTYYTFTYLKHTRSNTNELCYACQDKHKQLWTDLKHGKISTKASQG